MARTICGFVYGTKGIRQTVEKTVADMILGTDGAKPVYSNILHLEGREDPFEYFLFVFPNGGCLLEKHSSPDQLRLTLHFVGSARFYKGRDSLAEKILKYWESEGVRIGRDR